MTTKASSNKVEKAVQAVKETTTKAADKVSKAAVKAGETTTKKATEVKDAAVKKATEVKDATVKKATKVKDATTKAVKEKTKKASAKATEVVTEVYIQYQGQEIAEADIVAKVKEAHVAAGHRAGAIKSLQIYTKPEENAAYYVINKKESGKITLF